MIIAVIGMGSIGKRHARNLRSLGCSVVGYDPQGCVFPDNQKIDITIADSPDAAIHVADAVVISTPHSSHLEHMRKCIQHKKHFLVEKPISSSLHGLDEINSGSQELVAHVGYNLRFHPTVERTVDLIGRDAIGKTLHASFEYGSYLPSWRPKADYRTNYASSKSDGGIILDDIHEIDLACHIFGLPSHVCATATNTMSLGIHHEEIADIVLTGQHSSPATTIHMDYLQRVPTRRLKVIGALGTLEADLNSASLSISRPDGQERYDEDAYEVNSMYVKEMQHFLEAVQTGKSDETLSIRAGIETLRLALACRRSSSLKRTVEL